MPGEPRWTSSDADAGPQLDRLIELRVFGRKPVTEVPPYSTDDEIAELVIARLARPPLRWISMKEGDEWTFHWRAPSSVAAGDRDSTAGRYQKIASASAPTRPLAICRASLALLGPLHEPGRGQS
jgi:hypothetical protein